MKRVMMDVLPTPWSPRKTVGRKGERVEKWIGFDISRFHRVGVSTST